ncbi:uncharacterized protein LOC130497801 [Raphanus sativus]|uniref:Uncharacterized protein LOC130497801 n=1 Tax=Raphanus sativus TaxID=3726 RepID=A0A9W3C682_RAPSA|nr:uncharacterized protein LOC130497801 [Raphanus sativus]
MAVKTDMSKAYDRNKWSFLDRVLGRLGFHPAWISWIMECTRTVSYSFLVNGAAQGKVRLMSVLVSSVYFSLCAFVVEEGSCCRRASSKTNQERGIYVKHFKNIPMADMEIVLPEKRNPGLTPMDWVKFLISAVVGLVAVVTSVEMPKADPWVIFAVLSTVVGYCAKTYFTFQQNMATYQNLITQSMYDKQLDSGKGTLLHLCDDVIQQEVKEVMISFYILMEQGKATLEDLDLRCEELIKEEFGERCNFDVDDAVQKLEKLGIVARDTIGRYYCMGLKRANEIIGTTTEELVLKAKQGVTPS